jgi:hypothetical protein
VTVRINRSRAECKELNVLRRVGRFEIKEDIKSIFVGSPGKISLKDSED